MKDLKKYIGKYLVYTNKAILEDIGESDQIFAVVDVDGDYLIAWKCFMNEDGTISHPSYGSYEEHLNPSIDYDKIFINKMMNDSFPSAEIKLDFSIYKEKEF